MLLGGAAMGTLSSMGFKEKETYALKGNINHGDMRLVHAPTKLGRTLCTDQVELG